MMLKALQDIPPRGIKEGDTFKTKHPEIFIENRLGRSLTKEEIQSILDGYVAEMEKVLDGHDHG